MRMRHRITTGVAGLAAAAMATTTLAVPAQAAQTAAQGNRSLATVLAADSGFDRNWRDFDIVEAAVLAVLDAKPDSPVALLTKGRQRATAFVPTDAAFRRLVGQLTGRKPANERATFRAVVNTFDIDTIETVLLYHVVAGRTLNANRVIASEGRHLQTAAGIPLEVRVRNGNVILVDQDRDARNARVVVPNINRGNKQIGHGIGQVLRPIDL